MGQRPKLLLCAAAATLVSRPGLLAASPEVGACVIAAPTRVDPWTVPGLSDVECAAAETAGGVDGEPTALERYQRAKTLASSGRVGEALLQLAYLEARMPRIADRLAFERATLMRRVGEHARACAAFSAAAHSPELTVHLEAEVQAVRCALDDGAVGAERRARVLLHAYPNLSDRIGLLSSLAGYYAARHQAPQARAARDEADALAARERDIAARTSPPADVPQGEAVPGGDAPPLSPKERRKQRRARPTPAVLVELAQAAHAADGAKVTQLLMHLGQRRSQHARVKFDAAMIGMGVADDGAVRGVLESLAGAAGLEVAARYHLACLSAREGNTVRARQLWQEVIETDRSDTGFYRVWSRQRLADAAAAPAPARALPEPTRDPERMAAALEGVGARYRRGLPWIGRAADMARLGDWYAVSDEIFSAWMAWRVSRHKPVPRAGIEAVYRNVKGRWAPQIPAAYDRASAASLSAADQQTMGALGAMAGDPSLARLFGVPLREDGLPRPYPVEMTRAVTAASIDPNVLYAIMRQESFYNRRVVSRVGATGLMQIMPGTGRRIADRRGVAYFTPADLLNPEVSLTFAASYVGSLTRRFGGALPLVLAAYNAGPHNVRRWMARYHSSMPMEAFLELIPFKETHRYVRRVLGHYAAYLAEEGRAMPLLGWGLRQDTEPTAF